MAHLDFSEISKTSELLIPQLQNQHNPKLHRPIQLLLLLISSLLYLRQPLQPKPLTNLLAVSEVHQGSLVINKTSVRLTLPLLNPLNKASLKLLHPNQQPISLQLSTTPIPLKPPTSSPVALVEPLASLVTSRILALPTNPQLPSRQLNRDPSRSNPHHHLLRPQHPCTHKLKYPASSALQVPSNLLHSSNSTDPVNTSGTNSAEVSEVPQGYWVTSRNRELT